VKVTRVVGLDGSTICTIVSAAHGIVVDVINTVVVVVLGPAVVVVVLIGAKVVVVVVVPVPQVGSIAIYRIVIRSVVSKSNPPILEFQ
jgi:hypothetical protein